jgi:eukaryotic-like serine/threonine-protein kinase
MAPEQYKSARDVDARADVFSLGSMLYELVTGGSAFPFEEPLAAFHAVVNERYRNSRELAPHLPERMHAAIDGALKADPQARWQTVDALLDVWRADAHIDPVAAWSDADREQLYRCTPRSHAARQLSRNATTRVVSDPDARHPSNRQTGEAQVTRLPFDADPLDTLRPAHAAATPTYVEIPAPPAADRPRAVLVAGAVLAFLVIATVGIAGALSTVTPGEAAPAPITPEHTAPIGPSTVSMPVPLLYPTIPPPMADEPIFQRVVDEPAPIEAGTADPEPPAAAVTTTALRREPVADEPVEPTLATVSVTGADAWLLGDDGVRHLAGQPLEPGGYRLLVLFDADRSTDVMHIEVADQAVQIACSRDERACHLER